MGNNNGHEAEIVFELSGTERDCFYAHEEVVAQLVLVLYQSDNEGHLKCLSLVNSKVTCQLCDYFFCPDDLLLAQSYLNC